MFEKGFFAGVKSAPGLDDYPPSEIESSYHSNTSPKIRNGDANITTTVQSTVDHEMKEIDASIKNRK